MLSSNEINKPFPVVQGTLLGYQPVLQIIPSFNSIQMIVTPTW